MHEPDAWPVSAPRTDRPPRYAVCALPLEAYLPGRGARPAPRAVADARLDPDHPERCKAYLHAVDLFNHGFFWECHEVLEALWQVRPAGDTTRSGLQGLIQIAAAHLKRAQGVAPGARRLCERGGTSLCDAGPRALAIDTRAFASAALEWIDGRRSGPPRLRLHGVPELEPARSTGCDR